MIHTFEQVAVRSYENAEGAAPGHESMLCAVFGSLDKVVTSELVAAAWETRKQSHRHCRGRRLTFTWILPNSAPG